MLSTSYGEGTPTGAEDDVRQRLAVDEMRFFLPRDPDTLDAVIEAIYDVHSYYESINVYKTEVIRHHRYDRSTA